MRISLIEYILGIYTSYKDIQIYQTLSVNINTSPLFETPCTCNFDDMFTFM